MFEKSLNENLAPLRRYLVRNVGRPWSKIYGEISAVLDSRKTTGLHVLQHLPDFVATDTWIEGRTVMMSRRWGGAQPVTDFTFTRFPGCSGARPILRNVGRTKPVTELSLEPNTVCRLIDQVWYRFAYAVRDPNAIAEVVRFHADQPARNQKYGLEAPGDRRVIRYRDLPPEQGRYLARRQQCTHQEIAELDERIWVKKLA